MKRQRLALAALLAATLCVGAVALFLGLHSDAASQESRLEGALSELATAEARLDSDLLRVISLQLPHYDGVVASEWELRRQRDAVQAMLTKEVFRGNEMLSVSAGHYFETLDHKLDLLEQLKGEAAFLRNQISYIPFAVAEALPTLAVDERLRLALISQRMLVYHAHPGAEEARLLTQSLDQAGSLSVHPAAGPLLKHIQVYFQQRKLMDAAVEDYGLLDQPGWRQLLRSHLMAQLSRDQERLRLTSGLLWLFVTGLLGALAWAVSLLNRARRDAVQSTERLSKAIEGMAGAFALYDKNHRLVLSNQRCGEFYAPAAALLKPGMAYAEFVRSLIKANFVAEMDEEPNAVGESFMAEAGVQRSWHLPLTSGRWYQCSHTPTSDGGFICYSIDQTEHKLDEDKMRRLFTAVEQSPASIVITDTQGVIQYVNPWFCQITGFAKDEVLGQNPRILKSGAVSDEAYANLWRTISGGQVWNGELCNKKKSGELYWESASISPVRDETGRITSYVGVKRDITADKETASRLESTISELARSNAELEQFAYVASHDLREPLRMVSSYVSLLARRYSDKLDGDALEFIAFAKDGARRMDRLILDLLEYSRIGRISQPVEPVDLSESLTEALRNLEAAIADTKTRVEQNGPLPSVLAVPSEMGRLLQNLVGNAIKYRSIERDPEIHISAEDAGANWVICVADNGIGIAPEYYERVFGIFQRLHAHGEFEGTGIGLAVCRKIVQHSGGCIWVESVPGEGSRFYFSLPKA